ncbi:hypothetical protein ACROYT_G015019 [Oculina patagonica]
MNEHIIAYYDSQDKQIPSFFRNARMLNAYFMECNWILVSNYGYDRKVDVSFLLNLEKLDHFPNRLAVFALRSHHLFGLFPREENPLGEFLPLPFLWTGYAIWYLSMPLVSHNLPTDATVPQQSSAKLDRKKPLENTQEDYDQFVADGSWASRQKFYHNVTHDKLLDIELDKVCVPGLHISLGVFKKLHELENQCFELHKKVHLQLAVGIEQLEETAVNEKMQNLRAAQQHQSQVSELEEKANSLQEILNLQHLHSNIITLAPAYIETLQKEIEKLNENAKQEVINMNEHIIAYYDSQDKQIPSFFRNARMLNAYFMECNWILVSQLSSTLEKANDLISQIEVTTETMLTDYIAYVALGLSAINYILCCVACQCLHKILRRSFQKVPEKQIPLQTVAITPRQHKICKRCDTPKPISQENQNQSVRQGHHRGKK